MKHSAAPVALLWVSLWAGSLQAQPIEFDAASLSPGSDEGVTESWSHTVGTGPDRLLIVGVSYQEVGGKVSSVTWNTSENFTQIGEVSNSSDATAQIWMLVNPTSGTHTVAVNLTEEGEKRRCGAVSFFHVNQTTPVGSFFSAEKKRTLPK